MLNSLKETGEFEIKKKPNVKGFSCNIVLNRKKNKCIWRNF